MTTAVMICPGRGSYNAGELGYLRRFFPDAGLLWRLDAIRAEAGQEPLSALDGAADFSMARHGRGDQASALIYAASLGDFLSLAPGIEVVAVTGNSMGWYTALACAGVVTAEDGFRIANTMGRLMQQAMIGGQSLYPWMDEDWLPHPARKAALLAQVAEIDGRSGHRLTLSIDLGGMLVVAGNALGLRAFEAEMELLGGRFPMRLAHHAAFHSDLQAPVAAAGRAALPETLFGRNRLPMIDGRGHVWWPEAATPGAIRDYTLGHQVVETYDFTAAIRSAAREFAPDLFILAGPGNALGGAVAQALILSGCGGMRSRADFRARQVTRPLLFSMGLPEQRGAVTTGADR